MNARPRTAKHSLSLSFLAITYKRQLSRSLFDEASLPATKSGVIRRDSACSGPSPKLGVITPGD